MEFYSRSRFPTTSFRAYDILRGNSNCGIDLQLNFFLSNSARILLLRSLSSIIHMETMKCFNVRTTAVVSFPRRLGERSNRQRLAVGYLMASSGLVGRIASISHALLIVFARYLPWPDVSTRCDCLIESAFFTWPWVNIIFRRRHAPRIF